MWETSEKEVNNFMIKEKIKNEFILKIKYVSFIKNILNKNINRKIKKVKTYFNN